MIVTLSLFISGEQDPDFWWHLRIGRWMVDNGRLPATDIFTFTVPGHTWTDHGWEGHTWTGHDWMDSDWASSSWASSSWAAAAWE